MVRALLTLCLVAFASAVTVTPTPVPVPTEVPTVVPTAVAGATATAVVATTPTAAAPVATPVAAVCTVTCESCLPAGQIAEGTAVTCAAGTFAAASNVSCTAAGGVVNLDCIAPTVPGTAEGIAAVVSQFQDLDAFSAWAKASGAKYGVTAQCSEACSALVGKPTTSLIVTQCFACLAATRQGGATAGFVCSPTVTPAACAESAVCSGLLVQGADCSTIDATIPVCPACTVTATVVPNTSSSKKGLLGLLGLLGLIPLCCCLLLCLLCLCRRKKADQEVHFATFDPSCGPPATLPTHSIPCNVGMGDLACGTSFVPAQHQQWGTIA